MAAVLVGGVARAGGLAFSDRDWSNTEPVLALDPDGTGLLLLHDPATGKSVESTALIRIAEARNPGMLASFGQHVIDQWVAEGLVTQRRNRTYDWGTQQNFEYLNALLRAEVVGQLGAYLEQVKATVSAETVQAVAWSSYPPDSGGVSGMSNLAPIMKDWYGGGAETNSCETTECEPCGDPDGSVYCPGACASGCGGTCANCEHIVVPGIRYLMHLMKR
jgi:hypothetical protein